MQTHKKLTARLLSLVLSIAMVTTMTSATVFAAGGDVPLGISGTISAGETPIGISGTDLEAAITASGVAETDVTSLKITAGEVTTADWNYLKSLGEMTSFEIADDAAVTAVADIPAGSVGEPTFPRSIVSVTVPQAVTIGENAFTVCALLTTASFPAATEIGKSAFNSCALLTTASFPAAISIGKSAFTSCAAFTTVSFPAATTIGQSAFSNCALTSATFPEVTSIGDYAFQNCTKLDSVSFPAATTIAEGAFQDCELLTTASFPAVTSIGENAFQICKLDSVSFPAATTIGKEAFLGCTVLTSATFPKVSSIGENAFQDCALATLKLGATPPTTVGTDAFLNCPDTRALGYVDADGNDLTDTALTNAQAAYIGDSTAGAVADGKWYGWTIGAAAPTHKPVTNITGVPTTATAGTDLTLTGTVAPTDATNKTIVWSVKAAGTTGATISGNVLTTTAAGTVKVTATITNGLTASSDYTKDFDITVNSASSYKPVTDITGVPTSATAGTDLTLAGTVTPADATNKTIVWSVKNAGTTGATLNGNTLKTTAAGTVVVTASIANGLTASSDYTKDFTITVNPVGTVLYTITFNANGGSVSPATATTDAAGKLSGLPTPTRVGYTSNGWFTAASGGTAVTTTTVFTQDSTVYAQWTQNSSGGGGGSSSPAPSNTIYSAEGNKGTTNVVSQAIKNAIATGGANVSTSATFNNFDFLAPDGLKTINEIAAKESAGKTVNFTVNFDAGPKEPVNSRITVNPAALAKELTAKNITGKLPLGVWFDQTKDTKVQSVNTLFGKHFSNKIVSVVYDRNSTLAVNAEFCAKLNLAETFGTDKNLYFYTYDNTTNIYKRIQSPGYRVDKNGYAHITAPFGGSIIITDKPLTGK